MSQEDALEMSLRATSHGDLQTSSATGRPLLDSGLYKSLSVSSGNMNMNGGSRIGKQEAEEVKGFPRPCRRPVRAVRPVSALSSGGSFLQINHLQGELVRKRKECEDLKKENKYLSNEIHMERIMMRSENELTMRNLRNLNQELQAEVKELKQKVYHSQQRASLCSRDAERAEFSLGEAERSRALAQAEALGYRQDREQAQCDRSRLSDQLEQLKKEHADMQLLLAQTDRNYFETKLKFDRVSGEKQALLAENRTLEGERDELRGRMQHLTQENAQIKEKEVNTRRRAAMAKEQSEKAGVARQEAEQEKRLVEKERQERTAECLSWREKHQNLAEMFRAQEDLKAQRQSKACQANIKSYFLCMTESDQRVKILKTQNGTPRNFMEGEPVCISTPEATAEDADSSSSRTMLRVSAPNSRRDLGPAQFGELPLAGGERPDSATARRSRKVVDYFWIPTDE